MISAGKSELMLKDYLRDDLSSCSSGGFKSFPRRQCCTTVRFLLEIDLKTNFDSKKALIKRSRSRSALQRASSAVLSAVKQLPFSSSAGEKSGILRRSFSRNLSFWKKRDRDEGEARTGRSKLFGDFLEEIEQAYKSNPISSAADATLAAEIITPRRGRVSTSSNIWSESEISRRVLLFSSCDSENCCVAIGDEVKIDSAAKEVGDREGATDGEDSVDGWKVKWPNEDGKEQFSPVSVLENPFHDDDGNNSPFPRQFTGVEGSKHKSQRFPRIEDIEPLDLEKKCIAFSEDERRGDLSGTEDLFEILKGKKIPPNNLNADLLILDFFRERIGAEFEVESVKKAEEWFNGRIEEAILGWEVEERRILYLRDMERIGKWRSFEEERAELAAEMEVGVLDSLLEELTIDL